MRYVSKSLPKHLMQIIALTCLGLHRRDCKAPTWHIRRKYEHKKVERLVCYITDNFRAFRTSALQNEVLGSLSAQRSWDRNIRIIGWNKTPDSENV